MAEEITIPQQEITTGSFPGKNGPVAYVQFAAMYGGKLIAPCQAIGGPERKTELEKAMKDGTPVALAAAPLHNEQYNRWNIKFAGGGYGGGGGKTWTPAGYRGQPLTPDAFWQGMTDALIQAKGALSTAGIADPNGDHAQGLASQFFILIERNVIAVGAVGVPSTEPAKKVAQQVMKGGAETDQGEAWYLERIELCTSVAEVEALQDEIRTSVRDKVLLASLLMAALKAKRAMSTPKEGAA